MCNHKFSAGSQKEVQEQQSGTGKSRIRVLLRRCGGGGGGG